MNEELAAYVKKVEQRIQQAVFFRLDPKVKKVLQRLADEDGRSVSGLVSKIVIDWVKAKTKVKV